MTEKQSLEEIIATPVIPVLTISETTDAVALAGALAAGGLNVLEVTLRTEAALRAIRDIAAAQPEIVIAAGTVRTPEQAEAAIAAGALFIVSPGITPRLMEAARRWPVPFLPGVATASEAMALADLGCRFQKFFPAEQSGGVGALKAFAAPLYDIRFCPTGGISAANAPDYLALPNVVCVGGSWVAPAAKIDEGDWEGITKLAQAAAALR
jgi:2-dehydro-3-deoxyphosphogluconate aldolase / (4S)-4-hydroxy-2-oxoglutarate aldolase